MSRSLRRSRRSTKKGISDYNEGDIVEIDRNGVIAKGRLAQLLTEGPSPNPRWLIKFDAQPYKDEEMYERAFGKLISSSVVEDTPEDLQPQPDVDVALEDTGTAGVLPTSGRTNKANRLPHGAAPRKVGSTGASNKGGGSGSEGETGEDAKKGKNHHRKPSIAEADDLGSPNHTNSVTAGTNRKSVQFEGNSGGGSNDGSDDSSPLDDSYAGMSRKDRVSAREARSRRRQAKIDEDAVPPGTEIAGGKRHLPLGLDGHHPALNNKKHKQNETDDGEVVKVKLLTGTLYLYRGTQRRAEFVRRV